MAFHFQSAFQEALPYPQFLDTHGTADQQARWQAMYQRVLLNDEQKRLLASFRRKMPILCLAGVWCGDCVNACPIFRRFEEASSVIELRFADRPINYYAGSPLIEELRICGGPRVPVFVFLSEDWYECERFGERTLASYRKLSGASPPPDLLAANIEEWLGHVERVQWMLVTSPRLQRRHSTSPLRDGL